MEWLATLLKKEVLVLLLFIVIIISVFIFAAIKAHQKHLARIEKIKRDYSPQHSRYNNTK